MAVTNLQVENLRNPKEQSLMHVAAMVGDPEIAAILKAYHIEGSNQDVLLVHSRSMGIRQQIWL